MPGPDPFKGLLDQRDAALLLSMAPPMRPVQDGGGVLPPTQDPETDARIDRLVWTAALRLWEHMGTGDAEESQALIQRATEVWDSGGRSRELPEGSPEPPPGAVIHPVRQLGLERLGIVAARAGQGLPLAPELDSPAEAFSLTDLITGLLQPGPGEEHP